MNHDTKTCTTCGVEKSLDLFSTRQAGGKMYPRTRCKACRAAAVKADRAKNPDVHRARENMHRHRYFAANPEKRAENKARYRANQPGMYEVARFKSKMRHKEAMPAWANVKAMAQFYAVAAARRAGGEDVTVDHMIPLNHDLVCGLHNEFNLQYLTFDENVAKSNTFETM